MKKAEVGGAYVRSGNIRNTLKYLAWKPAFGRPFINLDVDGRLLLNRILKK